jgi:hypothetical protein
MQNGDLRVVVFFGVLIVPTLLIVTTQSVGTITLRGLPTHLDTELARSVARSANRPSVQD